MNRKYKAILKLNVISLFFIAISSISVTLAWFAYSGIASVSTEVEVKSWLIEFEKNQKTVSNDIVISLSEIYPGMDTVYESIKIKNKGDSNAQLSSSIVSARILDEELDIKNFESNYILDRLSHHYPFSINMDLDDNFILAKGEDSTFNISISWPLDSDNDKTDSEWGNLAYQFGVSEQQKLSDDPEYQIRQSIKIIISVKAEQTTGSEESSDINYPLGDLILYDINNNVRCEQLSETCIRTHVIDINNKVGDTVVTLLPDILSTYPTGKYEKYDELLSTTVNKWKVNTRTLLIDDILKIVSKDIDKSVVVREGISDSIMGYLGYENSIDSLIGKLPSYDGYFRFLNTKYTYFVTNKCYWLAKEYDKDKAFVLTKNDEETSKVYGADKTSDCGVIPVILAPKANLTVKESD